MTRILPRCLVLLFKLLALLVGALPPAGASQEPGSPAGEDLTAVSPPRAVVAFVHGSVWIERNGQEKHVAEVGLRLEKGDVIRAGEKGSASLYVTGGQVFDVRAGSQLEIRRDGSLSGQGTQPAPAATTETVEILDAGVVTLSQGGDSLPIVPLRGMERAPSGRNIVASPIALSPRNEIAPAHRRLEFQWRVPGARTTAVLKLDGQEIWRSLSSTHGKTGYPGSAPRLQPGETYTWVVEAADGTILSHEVPFRVPGERLRMRIALFEAQMVELEARRGGSVLANVLRCAFYLQLEAWTPVLRSVHALQNSGIEAESLRRAATTARTRMGLPSTGPAGWPLADVPR